MSILRYTASLDNTITNAFEENLATRGTGSSMGSSDILEVFSIYGQQSSTSVELSRVLIQFPLSQAIADRASNVLDASGSVTWKLKLYNAPHYDTTPRLYDIQASAVSAQWQEGIGLDMEDYSDLVNSNKGSNWIQNIKGGTWTTIGGDYHSQPAPQTQNFNTGLENLEIDVSDIVEEWIAGTKQNYGFGIRLTDTYEGYFSSSTGQNVTGSGDVTGSNTTSDIGSLHNLNGATESYYTKKFFGRGTEFFFKRPVLEAQFVDAKQDDRGKFQIKTPLLTNPQNLNNLYFYNKHNGSLVDIAGDSSNVPTLKLYYSSGSIPEGDPRGFLNSAHSAVSELNATRISTGIYKVQIAATSSIVNDTYPYLIDVWSFDGVEVLTGSVISPKTFRPETYEDTGNFVLSMTNLKPEYGKNDLAKLRLYAREKNWSPNIYTVAKDKPQNMILPSCFYKVIRIADELTVVDYGTDTVKYSQLSYDQDGNYFEFNMNMLEPGYQYGFKFSIYDEYTNSYLEQPYLFKFRVV